jgi:transposase
VWAVEGARGVGAGLAQRLVAEGEPVLDVPARLSARVRALGGGSGRKTDDADAFAVAVAGLRARELQVVRPDDTTEILRLLTARRQEVVELRIATVNRLHVVLCQLIPGGAKRHLSATKARPMLSAVRPRDAVGKARKQLALDYAGELDRLDGRLKQLKRQIGEVLAEDPTSLVQIDGIATINAAKILAEVGDVRRFASRHHFASYTGTAPIDVSSGENKPAPAQPWRQPTPQPRPAHRGRRAVPDARTRSGLLPAQARGRQDPQRSPALPQATHLRRGLSTPRRRPGSKEPGRTLGGVSSIQRG